MYFQDILHDFFKTVIALLCCSFFLLFFYHSLEKHKEALACLFDNCKFVIYTIYPPGDEIMFMVHLTTTSYWEHSFSIFETFQFVR